MASNTPDELGSSGRTPGDDGHDPLLHDPLLTAAEINRNLAETAAVKAAEKAAVLGLLQLLEAVSLDADELRRVTAAAVTFCDHKGANSFADLQTRASRLTNRNEAPLALSSFGPELTWDPACVRYSSCSGPFSVA